MIKSDLNLKIKKKMKNIVHVQFDDPDNLFKFPIKNPDILAGDFCKTIRTCFGIKNKCHASVYSTIIPDSDPLSSWILDTDVIEIVDENGIPETLSFDHVKTDAYGGIVEHVEATLEILPSIPRLAPIASTLPASEREALQNAIDTLGDNIRSGNFTQRVLMTEAGDSGLPAIYRNYYDIICPCKCLILVPGGSKSGQGTYNQCEKWR